VASTRREEKGKRMESKILYFEKSSVDEARCGAHKRWWRYRKIQKKTNINMIKYKDINMF
jgi:hypothetical protein